MFFHNYDKIIFLSFGKFCERLKGYMKSEFKYPKFPITESDINECKRFMK